MGAPRAQRGLAPTDSRAGGELAVNDGIKLLLCYKKSGWSAPMASVPQPKETSCTTCMSGWVHT